MEVSKQRRMDARARESQSGDRDACSDPFLLSY